MEGGKPKILVALYQIGESNSAFPNNIAKGLRDGFGIEIASAEQTVEDIRRVIAADTEKNIKCLAVSVALLDSNTSRQEVFAEEIIREVQSTRADIAIIIYQDMAGLRKIDPDDENTKRTFSTLRDGTSDDVTNSPAPGEFARRFKEHIERLERERQQTPRASEES